MCYGGLIQHVFAGDFPLFSTSAMPPIMMRIVLWGLRKYPIVNYAKKPLRAAWSG